MDGYIPFFSVAGFDAPEHGFVFQINMGGGHGYKFGNSPPGIKHNQDGIYPWFIPIGPQGINFLIREWNLLRIGDRFRCGQGGICAVSGVGRSTFYRLFDNVIDLLVYQCDMIVKNIADGLENHSDLSIRDLIIAHMEEWMRHKHLLITLRTSNRLDILFRAHMEQYEAFHKVFSTNGSVSSAQEEYAFASISALLPVYVQYWAVRGEKETAKELYDIVKENHLMFYNAM